MRRRVEKQEDQKIRRRSFWAIARSLLLPPSDLLIFLFLTLSVDCGKSTAPSAAVPPASAPGAAPSDAAVVTGEQGGAAPMDAREAAQWAAAKEGEGDAEELARLADLVGCEGLRERGEGEDLRMTAIRAMQYCRDFSELPWLAQIAAGGSDDEARAALETVVELAARPRRATDPEDADELHTGCGALLGLAKDTERARARRVLAIRALRMLTERGCVKRSDIPTDLDAR
jgi:hypothetical protein